MRWLLFASLLLILLLGCTPATPTPPPTPTRTPLPTHTPTQVNDIAIDAQDTLWIATRGGVSKFDGNILTTYTSQNSGLANNYVSAIAIDSEGSVWFGTDEGVSKFQP